MKKEKKKPRYLKRTYRITIIEDILVKQNAHKFGGESAYIRRLVREGVILGVSKL